MLRLGKLTDYGTVMLALMAQHPGRLFAAGELASASGVTAATASKILKRLAQADLLQSVRGARGGYRLARPAAEISLAQVIATMEGPLGLTECSAARGLCAQESSCAIRHNWQRINAVVVGALAATTLAEMAPPGGGPAPLERMAKPPRAENRNELL